MVGVLALAGLIFASPALAVEDVLDALRADPLFVSADSVVVPDSDRVAAAIADSAVPTFVAVLPQERVDLEQSGIDGVMLTLLDRLDEPSAVLVVVSDEGQLQAGEGAESSLGVSALLDQVLAERIDEPFGPDTLTDALVDLVEQVSEQAGPPVVEQSGRSATIGIAALVGLVAIGGGGALYLRGQRRLRDQVPTGEHDGGLGWQAGT